MFNRDAIAKKLREATSPADLVQKFSDEVAAIVKDMEEEKKASETKKRAAARKMIEATREYAAAAGVTFDKVDVLTDEYVDEFMRGIDSFIGMLSDLQDLFPVEADMKSCVRAGHCGKCKSTDFDPISDFLAKFVD